VSLTDLVFHGEPVTSDSLLQRWADAGTVSTPIGVSAFGSIEIDLLRDGPHLLVAGSTGSGKSELLRTLVAGLACHRPPDEVSFVLIDYKGGAAFAECSDLPHVLALVTDLDGHLTGRALSSLEAELRRRESAFASLSVSDLADYRRHPDSAADPLPRLILVVDEFATLAEELPTFLTGLIGIAQRGRSLGVHLVLATQRPAGVVSPEIKANTALRIALRVTDPGESSDIVGSDAAARISQHTPGRAHARMAAGLVEFQTAVVGLPSHVGADLSIHPLDRWNRSIGADVNREPLPTDLQLITDAARIASDRLGRQLPSEPWMAPLGSVLVHPAVDEREDRYLLPLALADEPAAQRQVPVLFDLHSGGAIGFIGATRSGRTTALRSLAGRAAERLTPDELHIHVIDCASNSLRLLAELPHCGTVVGREEPSLVSRLINLLRSEVARRHQLLAASAPDARAQSRRFPRILVLLDGWEGLTASSEEHDAGSTTEAMLELLRDGPSAGFTFAVTGGRAALGTRLSSVLGHRYVLEMLDRNDFAAAGIPGKVVPNRFTPGRAVSAQTHLEVQLYLLAGEPSTAGQWTAIEKIARARADQPGLHRIPGPPRITVKQLPTRIEAVRIPSDSVPAGSIALGVGGDLAGTISIEMPARGSRFLITGPSRSGRSNAALQIATRAALAGMPVVVAAPARSPLSRWARHNAIPSIEPSATSQSLDAERTLTERRFAIFVIDDAEQFTDTTVGDRLLGMMQADGAAVVATARSEDLLIAFRGIAVEMGRSRTGLLLQPSVADGDLFGIRLTRTRYQPPPGRGLLITDNLRSVAPAGLPIQVAWADVESDYGVPLA
jgi:S-DNA-T family DNA segregation ATPase FtsK/SpoIIIE